MRILGGILLAPLLVGCTVTQATRVRLQPEPNSCQTVEVARPLSTVNVGACWDEVGRMVGVVNGSGKAALDVATDLLAAGATLGAAALVTSGLKSLRRMQIDTNARVTGALDPLQVQAPAVLPPVQLLAPAAWPAIPWP